MPSLWKSGSTSGRAKAAGRKSIRGTISGPIPIPSALDDEEEFPIRTPGPVAVAGPTAMTSDDEFPMRTPGTGIAAPIPPGELDTTPESEPEKVELAPEKKSQPPPRTPDSDSDVEPVQPRSDKLEEVTTENPGIIEAPIHDIPPPEEPSHPAPEPPSSAITPIGRPASRTPPQRASPARTSPERVSPHRTSPLRTQTAPPARRTTNPLPSAVRYSVVSDAPSKQSQERGTPQRKKSTLRSALGRLFGRNKRKTTNGVPSSAPISEHESEPVTSSHHRSDPTALTRSKDNVSSKRSASLPINEFDRPLRSHSIGPDDIMAIESARNSLQAEALNSSPSGGPRRRAATTAASRLFYQPRLRDEWGAGLSPRPASTHGRGSSRLAGSGGDHEDPSEIGRAITSDNAGGGAGSGTGVGRRRSRSLSGLQDITAARPGTRRRSDEIRFWRESYDPGFMSPLSSNAPDDADADDTGVIDMGAPDSLPADHPPKTPPQPFNFGSISNEMVGMKITQAVSIDTRIGNLETRAGKLERVVDQLCRAVPDFRPTLDDPSQTDRPGTATDQPGFVFTNAVPPTIPAIYQTPPIGPKSSRRRSASRHSVETDRHSQMSFGDAPTFVGSLHPPSASPGQSRPQTTATANVPPPPTISIDRPTSTSTVRGATSLPTIGQHTPPNPDEKYTELISQLEAERAARLALEAQVKKLSERLNTLSTTMFAMVRDPAKSRSREQLATHTPTPGSSPATQKQISPKVTAMTLAVPPPAQKASSVFESDDDDEPSPVEKSEVTQTAVGVEAVEKGSVVAVTDTDLETEDFQTPFERPPVSYGAFGEELRADDVDDDDEQDEGHNGDSDGSDHKRKKAARTLSLSQLTLGKVKSQGQGQVTQI
ncbi:hypothetical protein V8F20_001595 [Naviculisporaceae sp. PSN 640]